MPNVTYTDPIASTHDYTIEQYEDARESRAWLEKFLLEHNGKEWEQGLLPVTLSDLVSGNIVVGPNGETLKVFWYRIKHKGVLIGYADAKVQPIFNGRKVISDVWILPKFRGRGHFHSLFPALVEHTQAVGICIMTRKYDLYGAWFESFGFEWLITFGAESDNMTAFQVTKDAYKEMLRFMIKHGFGHHFHPATDKGKLALAEVIEELEQTALQVAQGAVVSTPSIRS